MPSLAVVKDDHSASVFGDGASLCVYAKTFSGVGGFATKNLYGVQCPIVAACDRQWTCPKCCNAGQSIIENRVECSYVESG